MTATMIALAAAAIIGGTSYEAEATYYHESLAGEVMRNGQRYDPGTLTAASNHFGLGDRLTVCRVPTRRCVTVVVTDTGLMPGKDIDLSAAAFRQIGELREGRIRVVISEERANAN